MSFFQYLPVARSVDACDSVELRKINLELREISGDPLHPVPPPYHADSLIKQPFRL
jgi:hypothetical protein